MPTIAVDKADFWVRLGKEYSKWFIVSLENWLLYGFPPLATSEFDQLCFDFGLELDEDVRAQRYTHGSLGIDMTRRQRKLMKR